ncbi:MAG: PBP1A family penicillin-binding protein [Deltaproteobacteria bacterium]|nr:PBP1A family penicillin-binding protein [Deltaproteobacteria bacterium]
MNSRPEEEIIVVARKGNLSGKVKFLLILGVSFFLICVSGIGLLILVLNSFSREIPLVDDIKKYTPDLATKFYSYDDRVTGEFAIERRELVEEEDIPELLKKAFISAEDQNFYRHKGIEPMGILRAAIKNIKKGKKAQGGSTITQQVAKTFVGREKTYTRKLKEMLLALKLEKEFTKDQILFLYLNQVYLGHGLYGVGAAAKGYFRKNMNELTLSEMAMLAGLPPAPSNYSPFSNPKNAYKRMLYVLGRMEEDGYITKEEKEVAINNPPKVYDIEDYFRARAPYFTEHVRRYVQKRYGDKALYRGGLKVYTTVDIEKQTAAEEALIRGVREIDKRQGFRGPLKHIEKREIENYIKVLSRQFKTNTDVVPGEKYFAIIREINPSGSEATIQLSDKITGKLLAKASKWARPFEKSSPYEKLDNLNRILKVGDVVMVRLATKADLTHDWEPGTLLPLNSEIVDSRTFALEQEPDVQGALVSIDPNNGYVVAMIGGYSFEWSEFNRAFQSCRQPGSAFKPIVYIAAIEKKDYNPATIIVDSPIVFDDADNNIRWKPENFESDYKGDVTMRNAIVNSFNIPAVKTMQDVGIQNVIDYAKRLGISTELDPNLALAIGASCVTLWDLTNVYTVFARLGTKIKTKFIRRIEDRYGNVLEDNSDFYDADIPFTRRIERGFEAVLNPPERVLGADSTFILVRMLRDVCTYGTAAAASSIRQPVAGKTGTTNDSFDAWFIGFTRNLVTGVWVGYDKYEVPLGRRETGGKAALPIWMAYTRKALEGKIEPDYYPPSGIVMKRMDPLTGAILADEDKGGIIAPFKITTDFDLLMNKQAVKGTEELFKLDK